ncbi:MAG: GNAT family N-acetyltransferase [Gammaproteobacteria bacterium]
MTQRATPLFRPYLSADRSRCLDVFSSNVPRYFQEHERSEFETFIDTSGCPYFVLALPEGVVGCGGYGQRETGAPADLCWGMVAAAHHGSRLGEFLLLGRLAAIVRDQVAASVRLVTTQHTDGFFRRYGFEIRSRVADGYGPGLDKVSMSLTLTVERRQWIQARFASIGAGPDGD